MVNRGRMVLAAAAVALACGVPSTEASAYIYVGTGPTIARANNDGTGLDPDFISVDGFACGVAVDSNHIYWADRGSVGRANLDGSGVEQNFVPFTGSPDVCGVAVNGSHVYWTDRGSNLVGRVGLSGSSPDYDYIAPGYTPCGVAADANNVYYGANDDGHFPARANTTDGGALTFPGVAHPASCALAVSGANVYFGNRYATGLTDLRQAVGGADNQSATGTKEPSGIAVSPSALYWTNFEQPGGGSGGSVGTVAIDSSGFVSGIPNQSLITGISEPTGIAVDSLPVVVSPACEKARKKLEDAQAALKKLQKKHASKKKIKKAKKRVKEAKDAVASACDRSRLDGSAFSRID